MKIIKSLKDIPDKESICITIGNFDGLHCGHQNILKFVKEKALDTHSKFVIITFFPHPLLILKPRNNYLINTYQERRELLEKQGVDYLMEIEFGRDFSNLTPSSFLQKFISMSTHVKSLFLGHDFAFGADKKGNYKYAQKFFENTNVVVHLLPKFDYDGEEISSSIIRSNIKNGEIEKSNLMLQRKYFTAGTVIKGKARGSSIGFPTANISYDAQRILPSRGVYITNTQIDDKIYQSVTNIGFNPTFENSEIIHVETHILDFDELIYGKEIRILFFLKLREEQKFNSVNELVVQIKNDTIETRDFFRQLNE